MSRQGLLSPSQNVTLRGSTTCTRLPERSGDDFCRACIERSCFTAIILSHTKSNKRSATGQFTCVIEDWLLSQQCPESRHPRLSHWFGGCTQEMRQMPER